MIKRLSILLLIGHFLFVNCNTKNSETSSNKITTGQQVQLLKQKLAAEGGRLVVNKPGDPLNGLSIEVPATAYEDENEFSISYSPILKHDLGANFNPITPLILINNGAGEANELMKLDIPVKIPEGKFAMPFFYDGRTGRLEAMQVVDSNENFITVYTNRFSTSPEFRTSSSLLSIKILRALWGGDNVDVGLFGIIVSSIDKEKLYGDIMTPFKPGVDDWQFINWGSFACPKGHCAGQSIGMMWYYSEKKLKGSPPLYGEFDNDGVNKTPNRWEDDAVAYRFCSMLQLDWDNSWTNSFLERWQGKEDRRTLFAFAYAMMMTNQPQLAVIYPDDKTLSPAIVVYGMHAGTLYVADPNFPGDTTRKIVYNRDFNVYSPYHSSDNAATNEKPYSLVHYLSKSAVNIWQTAPTHWEEMMSRTIGKGKFPDYTIVALNEKDEFVPFEDGFEVKSDDGWFTLMLRTKGWPDSITVLSDQGWVSRKQNMFRLPQKPEQLVGVYVTDTAKHWVDFKWVKVKMPNINPDEILSWTRQRIRLKLFMDDVPVKIDSATFMPGDYFMIEGFGWGVKNSGSAHDYAEFIQIMTDEVKGPGEYPIVNGTQYWQMRENKTKSYNPADNNQNASNSFAADFSDPNDKGFLKIATWKNNDVSGRFRFWIKNISGQRKLITGEILPFSN